MARKLAETLTRIAGGMGQSQDWGEVAAYIPELAQVPKEQFAIAAVTADGQLYSAGAAQVRFSVQSITKVFTLAIALGRVEGRLSFQRRVLRTEGGRSILQNANTSATDFILAELTPGSTPPF